MTVLQVVVQVPPPPPTPLPPGLDPNLLVNQLFPVIGFVGLLIVAGLAIRWFFKSPIAEAIGERLRARTRQRFGDTGEEPERIAGLEQQITSLQGQLSELAERVDFAERMLAERRERKLSAGQ